MSAVTHPRHRSVVDQVCDAYAVGTRGAEAFSPKGLPLAVEDTPLTRPLALDLNEETGSLGTFGLPRSTSTRRLPSTTRLAMAPSQEPTGTASRSGVVMADESSVVTQWWSQRHSRRLVRHAKW